MKERNIEKIVKAVSKDNESKNHETNFRRKCNPAPHTASAYSKSQLATLYLPHIQPASARRTLRSWIAKNTALQNELARTGYSEKAILLTPAQVGLIFRFLGEP